MALKGNNKWRKSIWEKSARRAKDCAIWTKVTLCFPTPSSARQKRHSWRLQLKDTRLPLWTPSQRAFFLGGAWLQNLSSFSNWAVDLEQMVERRRHSSFVQILLMKWSLILRHGTPRTLGSPWLLPWPKSNLLVPETYQSVSHIVGAQ